VSYPLHDRSNPARDQSPASGWGSPAQFAALDAESWAFAALAGLHPILAEARIVADGKRRIPYDTGLIMDATSLLNPDGDGLRVGWLKRRDTRQVDVEGSPTQSRISPS
jgi:hypothetical protein